jgi:DNA-binding MarR family transcriptional regulator
MNVNIPRLTAAIFRTGQTILADRLRTLDISGGEMDILYVIGIRQGLSQHDLAKSTNVGKSSVTKVIKSLEAKGYVRRDRDPSDRRVWRVSLTDKGNAVKPEIQRVFAEFVQLHHNCLTDAEASQTAYGLEKVLAVLVQVRDELPDAHQEAQS